MDQKASKFVFSRRSVKFVVASILSIIFGIYSMCSIPGKIEEYQQAQEDYEVAREEQIAAINTEIDAYIAEGPISMNTLVWNEVADRTSYVVSYEEIVGPYASMTIGDSVADIITEEEDTYTLYYYLLSYIDGSGEMVSVILESSNDRLYAERLPDILYVNTSLEPDQPTLPNSPGKYESSYTLAQEIDPEVKCISLHIEYEDHDDFVESQERYRTNRIANSTHDLEQPSDQAITNMKKAGIMAFVVAAVLLFVAMWDIRSTAKKKQ